MACDPSSPAASSPRLLLLREHRYEMCFFHASDAQGQPIYHTNVMMAVGSSVAVVCLESVADPEEREHLRRTVPCPWDTVELPLRCRMW